VCHGPRLVRAHLSDGQTEPHRHFFSGSRRTGRFSQAVAQTDHGGEMQGQVRECRAQVLGWVSVRSRVDGDPPAGRRIRPQDRSDGRCDPRPGVGGEPAAAVGIEPIDGSDQAERARLHGLVEGFATQSQVVRTQRHEPQALADQIVPRAAITRPGSKSERAFTFRLERRLGQQVTRQGFHWTRVDAALIRRRFFTGKCGQVRAGDVAQVRIGTRLAVLRADSGGRYVMRGRRGGSMSRPFLLVKAKQPVPLASTVRCSRWTR